MFCSPFTLFITGIMQPCTEMDVIIKVLRLLFIGILDDFVLRQKKLLVKSWKHILRIHGFIVENDANILL